MKKKVFYNVWTVIEKVTVTDTDETYQDLKDEYPVKLGSFKSLKKCRKAIELTDYLHGILGYEI